MGVCQNTKNNRQRSQIKASPTKNNNFSKDNTAETGNEKQIESEEKLILVMNVKMKININILIMILQQVRVH